MSPTIYREPPVVYRDESSFAWGTVALILAVAVALLFIGYFAFWNQGVATPERTTIIERQAPVIPVPGPAGPPGPQGMQGPQGPRGPAAPEAPAAPAMPAAPSDAGAGMSGSVDANGGM